MPTAIISGVTGQDGALLAELLVRKNYRVIGLLPMNRESSMTKLEFLNIRTKLELKPVELLEITDVRNLLEEFLPDEFYNLAALSSVGLSFKRPSETFDFNTRSVMNILEAIRMITPKTRFYQASSSEMFGNVGYSSLPIKESFLFHPASPYGISKASAHWLTVNYREAYKLHACCGILFNHESALRPEHFVIKKVIKSALAISRGEQRELILGNLAIIRDWGYAPYYVEAMWKMVQCDKMSDYLICSGVPCSLQTFVQKVFNRLGLNAHDHLRIDSSLLRSLDLEVIYGDNTKAKRQLQWEYDLTPDDLIAKLIEDEVEFSQWADQHNARS